MDSYKTKGHQVTESQYENIYRDDLKDADVRTQMARKAAFFVPPNTGNCISVSLQDRLHSDGTLMHGFFFEIETKHSLLKH